MSLTTLLKNSKLPKEVIGKAVQNVAKYLQDKKDKSETAKIKKDGK